MEDLIGQLTAAGRSRAEAIAAVRAASLKSPVDGARDLSALGADYHVAFRVLSQPHIDAKEEEAASEAQIARIPLAAWFVAGAVFVGIGYWASKASYQGAVASGGDRFSIFTGLFYLGGGCFLIGAYKWLRR